MTIGARSANVLSGGLAWAKEREGETSQLERVIIGEVLCAVGTVNGLADITFARST